MKTILFSISIYFQVTTLMMPNQNQLSAKDIPHLSASFIGCEEKPHGMFNLINDFFMKRIRI